MAILMRLKVLLSFFLIWFCCAGQAAESQSSSVVRSVFSALKTGQHINVTQSPSGLEIGLLNDGAMPAGFIVVEIGVDYLVVDDYSGISRVWIPVTSIKKITHTKLPQ